VSETLLAALGTELDLSDLVGGKPFASNENKKKLGNRCSVKKNIE
jgi:hypothetical protein